MPNYKKRQQCPALTVGNTETDLPTLDQDIMRTPEKIFVQSLSTNSEPIWIGEAGTTADGANGGYELSQGSSMFLPGHVIDEFIAISASGGQTLLVTYLAGVY